MASRLSFELTRRLRCLPYRLASLWTAILPVGAPVRRGLAGGTAKSIQEVRTVRGGGSQRGPAGAAVQVPSVPPAGGREAWSPSTGGVNARPLLHKLQECAKKGDWLGILSLVREAKANRLPRNNITYSKAISALGKLRRPREAQEVLDLMKSDSFRPDVITYSSCIDACAHEGDTTTARRLLEELGERGLQPTIKTLSAYINVCAKAGDVAEALSTLREKMPAAKVVPDVITYNSCIDACAQRGDVRTAQHLLLEMGERGLQPDVQSFNAYMNACAKAGDVAKASSTLREKMPAAKVVPNTITYNSCIDACAQQGDIKSAQQLLKEMGERGLRPDTKTFSAYVNVCAKAGDGAAALAALREKMPAAKVVPDVVTYSSCIDACAQQGDIETARQLLDEMGERGPRPNVKTFSAYVNVCAKAGDVAEALATLREKMPAAKVAPNVITYVACIDACAETGDVETALRVLKEMIGAGLTPTAQAYTACVNACKVGKHWEAALEIHRNALRHLAGGRREQPSELLGVFNALLEVLDGAGRFTEADIEYERYVRANFVKLWKGTSIVDLHDHSKAMARAALRHVLRGMPEWLSRHPKVQTLTIVTGHGERRSRAGAGQLKDVVKQYLLAGKPPLTPLDVPGNAGCFQLRRASLEAYSAATTNDRSVSSGPLTS